MEEFLEETARIRENVYEPEEMKERYFRGQALQRAKKTQKKIQLSRDIVMDRLEERTMGRLWANIVVSWARWPWCAKILYQAYTGVCNIREHAEYKPLQPCDPPPSPEEFPYVTTSEAILDRWDQVPAALLVPCKDVSRLAHILGTLVVCGLFVVLKTATTLRLICDARPANMCFNKEEVHPLKLCGLQQFMEALDKFVWREDCFFLSGDLRHMYWQCPMAFHYAKYMSVQRPWRPGEEAHPTTYVLANMAMGFFPVCTWAETTSTCIILHVKEGDPLLGVCEEEVNGDMPRIIWLYKEFEAASHPAPPGTAGRTVIGFIVIIIDGFQLVTQYRKLAERWRSRIRANMKLCNAELKIPKAKEGAKEELDAKRPNRESCPWLQGLPISDTTATFAGLEIRKGMGWRPDADLSPFPTATASRREWSSALGEMLWAARVARDPLVENEELMRGYSALYADPAKGWDDDITIEPHQYSAMKSIWEIYKRKGWTPQQILLPAQGGMAVASDAHRTGYGYIIYGRAAGPEATWVCLDVGWISAFLVVMWRLGWMPTLPDSPSKRNTASRRKCGSTFANGERWPQLRRHQFS